MVKQPLLAFMLLAGALCLALAAGPTCAQDNVSQSSGQDPGEFGDQYLCDSTGARCVTFRCAPRQTCARTSGWELRDYSRGVDGEAPAYDNFTTADPAASASFDRRYDRSAASRQEYDRRYDAPSASECYDARHMHRQGEGYDPIIARPSPAA